jgi:hypothetical protein
LQHVAGARTGDRILRPLLGDRNHLHIELRPQNLLAEFEMLHHLNRIGRGGGHEIMVVGQPRRGAVVEHEAVLAEHQPVARLAERQRRESVGIDPVEKGAGVPALDVDLAEGRNVAHADPPTDIGDFTVHRVLRLLAGPPVIERAQPRPGFDKHRALLLGPPMRRREPCRAEIRPAMMAGERADGDGGERRAESGGADRAEIAPGDRSEHRRAVEIAGLALVGRHAERGVALEMFGDAEAFASGEFHVRHRDVVLDIDECLASGVGDLPHRRRGGFFVFGLRRRPARGSEPTFGGGRSAGRVTLGQTGAEAERAFSRAGHAHARGQPARHQR